MYIQVEDDIMSIRLYDEALLNKLKLWTKNSNAHVFSPSDTKRLFEVIADEFGDKPIRLPIICLRRNGGYRIQNTNKKPTTFDGLSIESVLGGKTKQLNNVPIEILYQIDIYTRYLDEADEYARNFVFNLINFNHLEVEIPYNDSKLKHSATLRIASDVEDNSDIPERLIEGQFTRFTLSVLVDDAYLWDVKYRDNYTFAVEDVKIDNT